MYRLVVSQVVAVYKTFTTNVTFVMLLSCVDTKVSLNQVEFKVLLTKIYTNPALGKFPYKCNRNNLYNETIDYVVVICLKNELLEIV